MNNFYRVRFGSSRGFQAVARSLAVAALAGVAGCNRTPTAPAVPPHAVSVATSTTRDVPRYVDALGQATAHESVNIVSQVEGQIVEMPFTQGSLVKAGDPLAKIFQPPFQAIVNEMDGELSSDQASLKLAESQVERSKPLLSGNLVSQQTYDGYVSQVDQLKGKVKVDQAQLDQAQINLNYTNITAPVDGMVGTYNINVGNVVKVNDVPITTMPCEIADPTPSIRTTDTSLTIATTPVASGAYCSRRTRCSPISEQAFSARRARYISSGAASTWRSRGSRGGPHPSTPVAS